MRNDTTKPVIPANAGIPDTTWHNQKRDARLHRGAQVHEHDNGKIHVIPNHDYHPATISI